MAIDDPLSAAKNLIESERRSDALALPREFAKRVAGVFSGPLSDIIAAALQKDETERLNYLLNVLEQEFTYTKQQVQNLSDSHDEHRRFIEKDFPPLLLDGFRKAAQTRAYSRIRRIAAILANSVNSETVASPDETEEFLQIATQLTDNDVLLLREIARLQDGYVSGDGKRVSPKTWGDANLRQIGMGVPDVFEIGPKLESFGLIRETNESRRGEQPRNAWPYSLLLKGSRFIINIQLKANTEQQNSSEIDHSQH